MILMRGRQSRRGTAVAVALLLGLLAAMDGGQSAKLLRHAKAKGLTTTFDLIAPSATTLGSSRVNRRRFSGIRLIAWPFPGG